MVTPLLYFLIIPQNHHMIRLETKRGCPYRCNFCAHRDLTKNRMHKFELERTFKELALIKQKEIHRVNVLDPTAVPIANPFP